MLWIPQERNQQCNVNALYYLVSGSNLLSSFCLHSLIDDVCCHIFLLDVNCSYDAPASIRHCKNPITFKIINLYPIDSKSTANTETMNGGSERRSEWKIFSFYQLLIDSMGTTLYLEMRAPTTLTGLYFQCVSLPASSFSCVVFSLIIFYYSKKKKEI